MFKNSEDEKLFEKVLIAYRQEFGHKNLIVYIPMGVPINKDILWELNQVRYWKRNKYRIQVKGLTAWYEFNPKEDE